MYAIIETLAFIRLLDYICRIMEKDSNALLIIIIALLCIIAVPLIIGFSALILPLLVIFIILFILGVKD